MNVTSGDEDLAGAYWDIDAIVGELRIARDAWRSARSRNAEYGAVGFPSRPVLEKIVGALCGVLFPLRLGPSFVRRHNEDAYVAETLNTALSRLYGQIRLELAYSLSAEQAALVDGDAARIIRHFAAALPRLRVLLDTDVEAAYAGDPAARSVDEVLLCHPSMLAIIHHRLAHVLHGLGAPLVARIVAEIAGARTGIDIHPGASIGERFFIDHGTGVVIGATAIIGARVRLHQAVTLGAGSMPARDGDAARHPIIEDDVVIHAGATILGPVTIGRGATIGGNVWITDSVPPLSDIRQADTRTAHREPMIAGVD